ncbi:MAG: Spy/CpxP family protein refolding chaperone [Gammaproteobacteria bacterium]|nr:Spy/CpxP family protein refolding chaperone [Gammaproteobacteria bacterium]
MKRTTKIVLGVSLATVVGLGSIVAIAGPGGGCRDGMYGRPTGMQDGAGGKRSQMKGGDPAARAEQRLVSMKQKLAITAEQESVWNDFAEMISSKASARAEHRQEGKQRSAITFDQRMTRMKERSAEMVAMSEAGEKLYAALNSDQQKLMDQMGPMGRGKRR